MNSFGEEIGWLGIGGELLEIVGLRYVGSVELLSGVVFRTKSEILIIVFLLV